MDALMIYNDRALNLNKLGTDGDIAGKASAYGTVLGRCDGIAGESIRQMPEFRRLIDGAKANSSFSKGNCHPRRRSPRRVMIELRSFDNLLDFRFG